MKISCVINGRQQELEIAPSDLLLDVLRDQLNLNASKPGCREGECGACTVLVDGIAVNACLFLAANVEGHSVLTVEGLGLEGKLDDVQQAMIDQWGVQCGFCTSGMVMAIKYYKDRCRQDGHTPTREEIAKNLEGNLCRCTGYVKIIDAAESVINKEISVQSQ